MPQLYERTCAVMQLRDYCDASKFQVKKFGEELEAQLLHAQGYSLVVITTQLTLLEYVLNGYRKVVGDA